MTLDPLYLFVFLGLFSPGPNVVLLTASGARFGFKPTFPHLLGVALGCGVIAGVTGFGVGAALATMPRLELALKILSAAWILYMAWTLWNSAAKQSDGKDRPMTFIEAILFQWVNPKIWAVALAAASAYPTGSSALSEAARLATAFSSVNFAVCLFWTAAGTLLTFLLTTPLAWRVFTRFMAAALAAFSVMVFL